MPGELPDEERANSLKLRFRFDYRGSLRPGKRLFGNRNTDRVAEEIREQQVALLRNVPIQGIRIEDVDINREIYRVWDENLNTEVAYAPAEVVVQADSLEEVLRFVLREEFRKVEVLEPEEFQLRRYDLERLLFKVNAELQNFLQNLRQ